MPPKRFYSYLKKHTKHLLIALVSVFVYLIAFLTQPYLVGRTIDFALNNDVETIIKLLTITTSLSILGAFLDFVFEYSISLMAQKICFDMRIDIFKKYNSVSIETLNSKSDGSLLRLEIANMESISNGIFSIFKTLVEGVLTVLITIVMMLISNWLLGLAVIVLSPLSLLVSRFVAKFSHDHFNKQTYLQANINSISHESIDNILTLQSLNLEDYSIDKFNKADELVNKEGRIAQFSASWTNPTTRLVNNIIYAIIGISGIIMIIFNKELTFISMTIGMLSTFLSYTTQFTKPFNEISEVVAEYESALTAFKRVDNFLSFSDDKDYGKARIDQIDSIRFDDLTFHYTFSQHLIEHFNLEIKKGDRIAIVGPTGAGKTTLINVLLRFYDPSGGRILVDNIDYTDIPKIDLRKNVGMVLQDTWIFNGTIKENIAYGKPNATYDEIIKASKQSHADSFINLLPNGYDTIISNNSSLSAGEKQMIAIARVMLMNKDIVILDEATSSIDTRSELLIYDAFDNLLKGKTSITIAHRLSTIVNADKILVLKDGNIIEQGSHKQLIAKKGFYYSLYNSQFD